MLAAAVAALALWACSSTKHVPDGSLLLDKVTVTVDDSTGVDRENLVNYLRQTPNHKVLGFFKLQLATYSLSGRDSTRWYNRWLRHLGQPPVIYSDAMTEASRRQLRQAMINAGYMDAQVEVDTVARRDKKKMAVTYRVVPGPRHRIRNFEIELEDSTLAAVINPDSLEATLAGGTPFDRDALDAFRAGVARRLRENGYYGFAKEYITFIADTAENSLDVDLIMSVTPPRTMRREAAAPAIPGDTASAAADSLQHRRYRIDRVMFVTDGAINVADAARRLPQADADTVDYRGIEVVYGSPDHYIVPSVLEEKCFIRPGQLYSSTDVDRTYESLSRLGIIRTINIEMVPTGQEEDGMPGLDAYIFLSRNKKQSVTLDLEGTNSEGDLGFGIGLAYRHRNMAHRSNLLTTKFRMNYESLSGNLNGLINDRYTEYASEVGFTFPKFMFPFLSQDFKRRINASTEVAASFNYQERPEYTRIIAGAAWKYKWASPGNLIRRNLDLLDINYVYLPESTIDFINQIAPSNPLLRYSYEDHFIVRIGYTYYRTNKDIATAQPGRRVIQPAVYSLRASAETAGNLLYAISSLSHQKRHDGVYTLFGIQYSQYAKAELDYAYTRNFTPRHALALHLGLGLGVPYGNSRVLPFEKRFYAGGANGVRGWGVRTLGPGSFDSRNSVTDFINQCGDIRLDLSAEYRAKLFWVFEGALFVDAGNIWTIHNYENQPGGMFHFDTFWKQIALAYGVGLRMDFSYFLLRFDLGMKAHNPARGQEPWPIIHPRWGRDATFHFSVGYPF
ncbi:MAG: BamA/TamA family outer membrane protein [Paramuribaculum sp.]|jgi:outer membrane protein assembly factor BamA